MHVPTPGYIFAADMTICGLTLYCKNTLYSYLVRPYCTFLLVQFFAFYLHNSVNMKTEYIIKNEDLFPI